MAKRKPRDVAKEFFQRKDHKRVIIAGDGTIFEFKHRKDEERARAHARKYGTSLDYFYRHTFKKAELEPPKKKSSSSKSKNS